MTCMYLCGTVIFSKCFQDKLCQSSSRAINHLVQVKKQVFRYIPPTVKILDNKFFFYLINIGRSFIPSYLRKYAARKLESFYLNQANNNPMVYAQNHWIEIYENPAESVLYKHKIYEQETTLFFRNYLQNGDTVYDIGANIGYFSLEFARSVGPSGTVFSFEPHPGIHSVLQRNIERNNYKNVKVLPYACGDKTGNTQLHFSSQNQGNHKIISTPNMHGSTKINITTLDKFISETPPRIIKMDIEGAEFLALKGIGLDNLRRMSIDFIIEFHPYEMSFFDISGKKLLRFLSDLDYKFSDLADPDCPQVTESEILTKYTKEDFGITNLYCTKTL